MLAEWFVFWFDDGPGQQSFWPLDMESGGGSWPPFKRGIQIPLTKFPVQVSTSEIRVAQAANQPFKLINLAHYGHINLGKIRGNCFCHLVKESAV